MKRRVVYTCITKGYENIVNPSFVLSGWDYICFTDKEDVKDSIWQIRPIPEELKNLSAVKQQRMIKILPHKYLPEYDESLYVDGAIDIVGNIEEFINNFCSKENKSVFIRKHPGRNCIYDEAQACKTLKKDTIENIDNQIDRYIREKYPSHNGLVESGIIFRKHKEDYCMRLMDMWSDEVLKGSHRDQLSFNYCLWKIGKEGFEEICLNLFNNPYFKWYNKHDR